MLPGLIFTPHDALDDAAQIHAAPRASRSRHDQGHEDASSLGKSLERQSIAMRFSHARGARPSRHERHAPRRLGYTATFRLISYDCFPRHVIRDAQMRRRPHAPRVTTTIASDAMLLEPMASRRRRAVYGALPGEALMPRSADDVAGSSLMIIGFIFASLYFHATRRRVVQAFSRCG